MKEINDIIRAHNIAAGAGKKTVLATVVKVEGSSYRQPGARMLVTEDGELTGAISGGCLEGDALRKALLALNQQQNKLITYDTSNEDDVEFGVQLGCNGIVHILFEYIDDNSEHNPMELLKQLESKRDDAAVITLFSLKRGVVQPGTVLMYRSGNATTTAAIYLQITTQADQAISKKKSLIETISLNAVDYQALIDYIHPPIALVVAGAGNDVKPVADLAHVLGWEVTIADGRATHATPQRFATAKKVIVAKPQALINSTVIDSNTFFVLMTHNYNYDIAMLKLLLETNCIYIGILGPKTKLNRMINDLRCEGIEFTDDQMNRIYGPVGIDIGAETSEEIALSVIAEIKAVMEGRKGTSLKYKLDKIHNATPMVN